MQAGVDRYLALENVFGQPNSGAVSSNGMVAGTSNPFAVHAGLEVLKQGGSAADAALTSALAQIALFAGATISYAGIMTAVYYDAASGQVHTLNAAYNTVQNEDAPLSIPGWREQSGRTALVPGFMAGVQALHDRFGKLPFARLFEPAIRIAENGVPMSSAVSGWLKVQGDFVTRLPETKRIFTRENGELYTAGDTFRQPELAETLKQSASHGAAYMYQGDWARRFVDAVHREGGKMTLEDLAAYRALWTKPLETGYRDYQVVSLGPPNYGGLQSLASLKLAEAADVKQYGHYTGSSEALYYLIQISRIASLQRSSESLGKDEAERLWAYIRNHDPNHSAGVLAVDEQGNVASVLHTLNGILWGSTGIFVDGVSIPDSACFQQRVIASVGSGARLPEGTNPLLVLKGGKPVLASTTIGSGLHQATLQNLINVLDFGMNPKTSGELPNTRGPFYGMSLTGKPGPDYDKEAVGEGDFSEAVLEGVRVRGQAIKTVARQEQAGYWIGIQIDPQTHGLSGGVTAKLNAFVEGY